MAFTHLSLFSGFGCIDLAAELAGFQTVGQCELEDYPTRVLQKHWPNVSRWRDVRDVTRESVERVGINRVSLVSAGYPCQTFSLAGKQTGDLDLANEFIRIVGELRPTWALGENVYGHLTNGLDDVMCGLENQGYETWAYVLRASDVGAPHERKRVFVVAYAGSEPDIQEDSTAVAERSEWNTRDDDGGRNWGIETGPDWPIHPSGILGTYDGLANRMERSVGLGNGVVVQQVYPILKAIHEQLTLGI